MSQRCQFVYELYTTAFHDPKFGYRRVGGFSNRVSHLLKIEELVLENQLNDITVFEANKGLSTILEHHTL